MLEAIYIVRHGFRANWSVDPDTGRYSVAIPTPTGIPTDPPLSSKGDRQARELAEHLISVQPSIDLVVSSPYYRCLQTIRPFVELAASNQEPTGGSTTSSRFFPRVYSVRPDPGFAEWYGLAPFEHPTHASIATLSTLLPTLSLDAKFVPQVAPPRCGESLDDLHNRVADAIDSLIRRADAEGTRAVLVCVHAAVIIAMGRALTGRRPEDVAAEDFGAFTCGLSVFRRIEGTDQLEEEAATLAKTADTKASDLQQRPANWQDGGVGSDWVCEQNSNCGFLSDGEERGWRFSGDESFRGAKRVGTSTGVERGIMIEGQLEERKLMRGRTGSHL